MDSAKRVGRWVIVATLAVGSAAGCAKAQAKAAPDGPPLAVPPPPPRVLAPVEPDPVAANPPAPEPAAATPPRTTARPATPPPARRPTTTVTTEPDPKPAETPAAVAPTPEPPPAATRPAPTPADVAAERRVRDVLRKAANDLGRVVVARLSADGKGQYEQARRLAEQADQALKDRNYAFAATLADKAAAIATELLGR